MGYFLIYPKQDFFPVPCPTIVIFWQIKFLLTSTSYILAL
jgi:hypothetical protein